MGMDSSGMPGSALNMKPMVSRRGALRAGALGLGVVWVTPVLSVVSMESASGAAGPPASGRTCPTNKPRAQGGLGVVAAGAGAMGVAAAVKRRAASASARSEAQ